MERWLVTGTIFVVDSVSFFCDGLSIDVLIPIRQASQVRRARRRVYPIGLSLIRFSNAEVVTFELHESSGSGLGSYAQKVYS